MVPILRALRGMLRNGSPGLRWALLTPGAPRTSCVTLGQSLTLCVKERWPSPCVCGAVRGPVSRGLLSHSEPCVSESEASPSIFPLSLGNNDPAEQVVIGCLVQGFFPSAPLSVTWNQSGDNVSVRNFPAVLDGNQYTMSSQLTLPASLCPENKFVTCQVQHLSKASKTVDVPCKRKGQRGGWGEAPSSHPNPTWTIFLWALYSDKRGLSPQWGCHEGPGLVLEARGGGQRAH